MACCRDTARGGLPHQRSWFVSSCCSRTHWLCLVPSPGQPTQPPLLAACSYAFLSTFSRGPETLPVPCGGDLHRTDPLLVAGVYKTLVTAGFACKVRDREPGDHPCSPESPRNVGLVSGTFWPPISMHWEWWGSSLGWCLQAWLQSKELKGEISQLAEAALSRSCRKGQPCPLPAPGRVTLPSALNWFWPSDGSGWFTEN